MSVHAVEEERIRVKFESMNLVLNERQMRLWLAAEAKALGMGGQEAVTRATGVWGKRIYAGLRDLEELEENPPEAAPQAQRIRRPGAGRPKLTATDPQLMEDLEALVEPLTRGDPMSPLRWTCKSLRELATEMQSQGHKVSHPTVGKLLHQMEYSLQSNRKNDEGNQHPDRNAQFEHINATVQAFMDEGQPAISVDTKKKELVGNFKNGGAEWQPAGRPETVNVHDFPSMAEGKAIPYGVYDIAQNNASVSVGIDHDTAAFAVSSIEQWWRGMGQEAYPEAGWLLVTADSGGSNSSRGRLWKCELQRLANETGLHICVCHYPPGTSKWNKIEHRLFSRITKNWRGRPLIDYETVVNLIGSTTTKTGLRVEAHLDVNQYPTGIVIKNREMRELCLSPDTFHGDWNYTISPVG